MARTSSGPRGADQQAQQLLAHPLGRQARKPFALGNAGGKALGVGRALAILGRQPEEAQDAQVVLADALPRLADEAHAARREVGDSRRAGRTPRRRRCSRAR